MIETEVDCMAKLTLKEMELLEKEGGIHCFTCNRKIVGEEALKEHFNLETHFWQNIPPKKKDDQQKETN